MLTPLCALAGIAAFSPWDRPVTAEAIVGTSTPSGFVALGGDFLVEPWFAVATGVGTNFSGVQWSVTPRVQLPIDEYAIGLGGGVSGGPNQSFGLFGSSTARWDHAWWVNGELSLLVRDGHLQQRWALGYGYILNDEDCHWSGLGARATCANYPATTLAPYLQYAVGYVF